MFSPLLLRVFSRNKFIIRKWNLINCNLNWKNSSWYATHNGGDSASIVDVIARAAYFNATSKLVFAKWHTFKRVRSPHDHSFDWNRQLIARLRCAVKLSQSGWDWQIDCTLRTRAMHFSGNRINPLTNEIVEFAYVNLTAKPKNYFDFAYFIFRSISSLSLFAHRSLLHRLLPPMRSI